jgi:hypothetical protein
MNLEKDFHFIVSAEVAQYSAEWRHNEVTQYSAEYKHNSFPVSFTKFSKNCFWHYGYNDDDPKSWMHIVELKNRHPEEVSEEELSLLLLKYIL